MYDMCIIRSIIVKSIKLHRLIFLVFFFAHELQGGTHKRRTKSEKYRKKEKFTISNNSNIMNSQRLSFLSSIVSFKSLFLFLFRFLFFSIESLTLFTLALLLHILLVYMVYISLTSVHTTSSVNTYYTYTPRPTFVNPTFYSLGFCFPGLLLLCPSFLPSLIHQK